MASMHGGRLVNDQPDSPHRLIARMKAQAYFAWADQDAVAPPEHAQVIQAALAVHRPDDRLEWHLGALHGFTFPERYCYHKAAAERVWNRLFTLFRRQLDGSSPGKP
jgi:carboxymethylenebutenolidase